MLQPHSKMTAEINLKSLGLKWLCPHTETRTAPCLSFPGWEGSSLAFTAIVPSQQGKLRLQAQVLAKALPGDKRPGVPSRCPRLPASQPSGSNLKGGIWRVQEYRTPSRAGQGMLAGCPTGAVLAAGTGSPVDGLTGGERVHGCSHGLHTTKDSEGHMGLRWEGLPEDRVSSVKCLP